MATAQGGYFCIPNSVINLLATGELDRTAFAVLAVLCKHADPKGRCFPNQATIGELVGGVSTRTVTTAIRKLESLGLVVSKRTTRGVEYAVRSLKGTRNVLPVTRPDRKCISGATGNVLPVEGIRPKEQYDDDDGEKGEQIKKRTRSRLVRILSMTEDLPGDARVMRAACELAVENPGVIKILDAIEQTPERWRDPRGAFIHQTNELTGGELKRRLSG